MISIANEISKLNELKEKGIITAEDFEIQKNKLISSSNSPEEIEEKVFFSDRGVNVTTTLFSLPNNNSFAMSGVTAVRAHKHIPSKTLPGILIIIGVVALIGGIQSGNFLFGLIMLLIGGFWFAYLKPTYFVVLSTASGETQALKDSSQDWILKVVEALNACIIYRK